MCFASSCSFFYTSMKRIGSAVLKSDYFEVSTSSHVFCSLYGSVFDTWYIKFLIYQTTHCIFRIRHSTRTVKYVCSNCCSTRIAHKGCHTCWCFKVFILCQFRQTETPVVRTDSGGMQLLSSEDDVSRPLAAKSALPFHGALSYVSAGCSERC